MAREPRGGGRDRRDRDENPEFQDRLVAINRVSKTVKGGKRFGFAALVVVGDQKGRVGYGKGKAREVPEAIRKATEQAKRQMVRVPLREGRTLHHDINGRHGAGKVVMRSAPAGTGIIAGGPMRAVFEMLGVHDVVAKSLGIAEPLQHDPRHHRRAAAGDQPAPGRAAPRQEGRRHPAEGARRPGRSRGGGLRPWPRPKTIVVKQIGSPIRRPAVQRATLIGLGLNKMHKTRELPDTPSIRGMVAAIPHLATIVEERG